jgi:hypothetical protein
MIEEPLYIGDTYQGADVDLMQLAARDVITI